MTIKLSKNEKKAYQVISRYKNISQPDLIKEFSGDYKNIKSKRVCASIALNSLMKKKLIKLDKKDKNKSGIPTNVWKIVDEKNIAI